MAERTSTPCAFTRVQTRSSRPNLGGAPIVTTDAPPRSHTASHRAVYFTDTLLHARALGIRLRFVDHRSVIQVRDTDSNVVNELRRTTILIELQILRLVGHLVVVAMSTRREKHDWNAVARVHVVIAAAVDVL